MSEQTAEQLDSFLKSERCEY